MNLPFYHALYLAIRENNKQLIEAKKSRYEGAMLLGDEQSFLDGFIDSMYSFYRYARGDATLLEKSYVREQKRLNSTQRDSYNYSYNGAKFLNRFCVEVFVQRKPLITQSARFVVVLSQWHTYSVLPLVNFHVLREWMMRKKLNGFRCPISMKCAAKCLKIIMI
jgi:hypothetical protein